MSATEYPITMEVQPISFDREADSRDLVPGWATNRAGRRAAAKWFIKHHSRIAAFHAMRSPLYGLKLAAYSPVGAWQMLAATGSWIYDGDAKPEKAEKKIDSAQYRSDLGEYRRARAKRLGFVATTSAIGTGALAFLAPSEVQAGLGAVTALGLGGVAWPRDKRLTSTAALPIKYDKVTRSQVAEALVAIGAAKDVAQIKPVQDPARTADGSGWITQVDMPVTAESVCRKRKELAGALGNRDMAMVWPREVRGAANRLEIYVADEMRDAFHQPDSPIFTTKELSYFGPLPVGTDEMSQLVTLGLAGQNIFLGAMTRGAKSTMIRQIKLAVSLIPGARSWTFNAKGNAFFEPFRDLDEVYISGRDDESIRQMIEALDALERECTTRSELLTKHGLSEVTEHMPPIEGLGPLVVAIDECHRIFNHPNPEYGKEARRLITEIASQNLSLGITLVLATQRGLNESIPKAIMANVRTRWCGMVADQIETDAILNTAAWGKGFRADEIEPSTGQGFLTGQGKGIQPMRVFNPDEQKVARFLAKRVGENGGPVARFDTSPPVVEAPPTPVTPQPVKRSSKFPHLLQDIADMMREKNEWRLWCREIAPNLPERPEYVAAFPHVEQKDGYVGPDYNVLALELRNILGTEGLKKSMKKNGKLFSGVLADTINSALEGVAA